MTEPAQTADQNVYGAFYVDDTYQVTRKLTLNLGVRVDLQGDWTERYNRIVVFNPTETSPIARAGRPTQSEGRVRFGEIFQSFGAALPFRPGTTSARASGFPTRSIKIRSSGPDMASSISRWMVAGMMHRTTSSSTPSTPIG